MRSTEPHNRALLERALLLVSIACGCRLLVAVWEHGMLLLISVQLVLWSIAALCHSMPAFQRRHWRALCAAHYGVGTLALFVLWLDWSIPAMQFWQWSNGLVLACLVPRAMVLQLQARQFALFSILLTACACYVLDVWHVEHPVAATYWRFALYGELLLMSWLVWTWRVGALDAVTDPVGLERSRIAQDLHDGVGSRLVGLIAQQDPDDTGQRQLADALQDCLLELQLTVDGLHDQGDNLVERLGRLRYRLQPALDRAGVMLVWDVQPMPSVDMLSADATGELFKIAQEALANILRHAGATRVEVHLSDAPAELIMEIHDDGRGALQARDREAFGHGLSGMSNRCRRLGGTMTIDSAPGAGMRLRWTVPLPPPGAGA